MTTLISLVGIIGRAAGKLLGTALGWASSLLFGRVPRSHQIFVSLLMGGSLLWVVLIVATLLPGVAPFLLDATPHPAVIGLALVRGVILFGLLFLPVGVGLAGYLVPSKEDRPTGLAAIRELLKGYPLALLMTGILIFLGAVGVIRKVNSARRGWSDVHVPIVAKPGGYDAMVSDLQAALTTAGLPVTTSEAPRVLSIPGRLLARVGGGNVGSLVPDRLVELKAPGVEISVYPYDISISGERLPRTKARAAILSGFASSSSHLTTSAEAQAVEDRLEKLASGLAPNPKPPAFPGRKELGAIDRSLLELDIPTDEWDILYRLRLQVERDSLAEALTGRSDSSSPARPAAAESGRETASTRR